MTRARLSALLMAVLLLIYIAVVVEWAVRLIAIDDLIARIMGIALIVLPLIGLWALTAELLFGWRAERLAKRLADEGGLPVDSLPHSPSGRPNREAADAEFPAYREAVEAEPESWRAWYRLGLAYDASGDRKRARWAIRQSIAFWKTSENQRAA